jgi:hypothetical protein
MTTISVPGKITALEIDESNDFAFTNVAAGTYFPPAPPTPVTLLPSGKLVTIVLVTYNGSSGGSGPFFKLSAAFDIGDIVELHRDPNDPYAYGGGGFNITDENDVAVPVGTGGDIRLRKLVGGAPTYTYPGEGIRARSTWAEI